MPAAVRAPHFVRSFERGLAVIRSFDAEHPARTLSEVARACELTRAAARRLLLTLADLGYVQSDGRLFRLTPRVLELGYSYLAGSTLPQIVAPHLEQLVARTGESASLCVLDGDDVVHIACLPARRIVAATIIVGTRHPAHATAAGRVLLAHLPGVELAARPSTDVLHKELHRIRHEGYALVDEELEEGLRTIAAPVRDRDGAVVAGVSVGVHAGRHSAEAVRRDLLPQLLAAVALIDDDLRITDRARAASPGSARRR
ncbi:IclR family transcriptional regulator C-terminal domain-containing protein [Streptomyces sp. MBT53]|uniref:IclR family transcriptional regulator domain-containing protein n=1 Tax=Streptomyces sp. MBT53 TaxID=1488384 RepID=UPI0019125F89|nr:IclR family transcriptional regulator C-terminal domain-containing protein [Streptomyces sp. MBT53]MBK6013077.1 helix-turn-helix domain-containing protein [Streptomyces sp. MBT53]